MFQNGRLKIFTSVSASTMELEKYKVMKKGSKKGIKVTPPFAC